LVTVLVSVERTTLGGAARASTSMAAPTPRTIPIRAAMTVHSIVLGDDVLVGTLANEMIWPL
jgi:hypothetical protein